MNKILLREIEIENHLFLSLRRSIGVIQDLLVILALEVHFMINSRTAPWLPDSLGCPNWCLPGGGG